MAVLVQAVQDVQSGERNRRERAIADIAAGGLDHWVTMVVVTHHAYDRVHEMLRELIEDVGVEYRGGRDASIPRQRH